MEGRFFTSAPAPPPRADVAPPESSFGLWRHAGAMPLRLKKLWGAFDAFVGWARPHKSGAAPLSNAVAASQQVKVWKRIDFLVRMRASSSSSNSLTSVVLSQYSPLVGVSRQPIKFISVDLPSRRAHKMATVFRAQCAGHARKRHLLLRTHVVVFQRSRAAIMQDCGDPRRRCWHVDTSAVAIFFSCSGATEFSVLNSIPRARAYLCNLSARSLEHSRCSRLKCGSRLGPDFGLQVGRTRPMKVITTLLLSWERSYRS